MFPRSPLVSLPVPCCCDFTPPKSVGTAFVLFSVLFSTSHTFIRRPGQPRSLPLGIFEASICLFSPLKPYHPLPPRAMSLYHFLPLLWAALSPCVPLFGTHCPQPCPPLRFWHTNSTKIRLPEQTAIVVLTTPPFLFLRPTSPFISVIPPSPNVSGSHPGRAALHPQFRSSLSYPFFC